MESRIKEYELKIQLLSSEVEKLTRLLQKKGEEINVYKSQI